MAAKSGGGRPTEYRLADGTRVPGVTTITHLLDKPGLVQWAYKLGREGRDYRQVRDEAAEKGKAVHAWIEKALVTKTVDASTADPAWRPAADAFAFWLRGTDIEIDRTEVPLVSEAYRFGGTIDALTKAGVVVDWKSGNRIYAEHVVQVAAYSVLANDEHGRMKTDHAHILRVDKDTGGFAHIYLPEQGLAEGWAMFRLLRELYDQIKKVEAYAR